MNWHGKPLGWVTSLKQAFISHLTLTSLIKNQAAERPSITSPANDVPAVTITNVSLTSAPIYNIGDKVATRQAYGTGLAKQVQAHPRVVALDGDMENSTFSQKVV